MQTYIYIALIILSVALIAAILLQSRGGGLGNIFGGEGLAGGQYKARRGLQKTLFQVTIGLAVAFFVLVVVAVFLAS